MPARKRKRKMTKETTEKTRIWRYVALLLGAVLLILLPVDAYATDVPVWLMMVLLAAFAFSTVMMWRAGGKRLWRILGAAAAAAVGVLVCYSCFFYPYWNSVTQRPEVPYTTPLDTPLTPEQAREDVVRAYRLMVKTHPALRGMVPENFKQAAEEAHERIRSEESLTVAEVGQLVERMASSLDDAHTGVNLRNLETQNYLRSSGLHARRGDRLVAVNGKDLDQLVEECADLLSFETPGWGKLMLADYLVTDAGLAFLGLPAEDVAYTYETPDGHRITERAGAADFVTLAAVHEITEAEFAPAAEETADWVSYEIDEEHSLAVLTLDQCINSAEYLRTLHDMFTEVKEKGIRNVAVDLRNNGGGDSSVATEFIKYLDVDSYEQMGLELRSGPLLTEYPRQTLVNSRYGDLTFDGDLYVLTSPATFSSAMLFTEYLTDNGLAVQIGEPPGNIADGYGEVVTFRLPNTGLLLGISTKKFGRIAADRGSLLEPEVAVEADSALDALRGRLAHT